MTTTVGIFVFEDVEVLDFAGPYEVFTTASRVDRRAHPSKPERFDVFTVGSSTAPIRARAGLWFQPDNDFDNHPSIDLLIVPGGVISKELDKSEVINWIARLSAQSLLTASVCTGAFLLAKAGLLNGKAATTHWEDIDELRAMFPAVTVRSGVRWVDEGSIVTAAGISAGIDMSLHLVERLAGRELAIDTAHQLDFAWTENS